MTFGEQSFGVVPILLATSPVWPKMWSLPTIIADNAARHLMQRGEVDTESKGTLVRRLTR